MATSSNSRYSGIEEVILAGLDRVFPASQVVVRRRGETVFAGAYGWLDPEARQHPTRADTLFDMASVTKLFVVTAFMTLVEEGVVGLDQPVRTVLPDFCGLRPIKPYEDPLKPGAWVSVDGESAGAQGVDAGQVTFRNLLSHNSGLPAWRPLYQEGNPEAARRLALTTYFSYPLGTRVIYSDIGLILLGMAVEQLTGLRLDQAVHDRVTGPLGLARTRYLPMGESANGRMGEWANERTANTQGPIPNIAPTEICAWRGRRIVGEVHDENAAGLGGIAGHAGIFSTAGDVAAFGQAYLDALRISESANQRINESANHSPFAHSPFAFRLLRSATVAEMVRLQAEDGMTRRGLGFALWSPDPEASGNPFSPAAFGHTGFTGTSLWVDPDRGLVVACLTNRVYYGRDAAGILAFRVALHRAIVEAFG